MPVSAHDIPISASAEGGEILLDGPDGLATSLTPAAATQSAKHLTEAVESADRQRAEEQSRH